MRVIFLVFYRCMKKELFDFLNTDLQFIRGVGPVLAARFLHGVASFLLSVLAFSIFKPDITTLQGGIKAAQYPLSTTFTIIICAILFLVCLNPNNRNFVRRTKNVKINL